MKKQLTRSLIIFALIIALSLCATSCDILYDILDELGGKAPEIPSVSLDTIPEFTDLPYVIINDNQPFFTDEEKTTEAYEYYGKLDKLGRCTVTIACVGKELMPSEDRESLSVKPSGWVNAEYDFISGKYLYNRCHLIGFQLTGENDNPLNLITGTRYLNIDGMLPFENMVADYVKETGNHVMYRVTPIFNGDNLVASGVLMEGYSVEDNGEGICFNIYAYNNQPGVIINYKTGESCLDDGSGVLPDSGNTDNGGETDDGLEEIYYINTNTHKYHNEDCRYASGTNVEKYVGTKDELEKQGYVGCGICNP